MELCVRFCGKTSAFAVFCCPSLLGCWWNSSLSLSLQVRDYSGTYTMKMIACTTAPHQEYSLPVICNPREPITFDLDIRFQQVPPKWYLCHVSFLVWFPNCLCWSCNDSARNWMHLLMNKPTPKLMGQHMLLSCYLTSFTKLGKANVGAQMVFCPQCMTNLWWPIGSSLTLV